MQILDSDKDQMGTLGVEGITSTQKNELKFFMIYNIFPVPLFIF